MSDDSTPADSASDDTSPLVFTDYRPETTPPASRPSPVPAASPEMAPDGHALETLSPSSEFTHDRGLGSSISTGGGDEMNPRKERLHRFARLEDWSAETIRHLLPEIQRIASALDQPRSVGERASHLCRQFQKVAEFTGASLEEWAGAFVFTAIREQRDRYCPRTRLLSVMKTPSSNQSRSMDAKLSGCYSRIQTTLNLAIAPLAPDEQVPAVATRVDVGLSPTVVASASELAQAYMAAGKSGTPTGIAAAALVVAGAVEETDLTIAALARAADVGARTVYRHRDTMIELGLEVRDAVGQLRGNPNQSLRSNGRRGPDGISC